MNSKHNPKLTHLSQHLRTEMTKEERHLWYDFLQGLPITINRQKIIGSYIADFYCASAKLVIELDGSQHYEDTKLKADENRDKYLRSFGLTIKRYSNAEINQDFESVCLDIYNFLFPDEQQPPHPALRATFPSRGRPLSSSIQQLRKKSNALLVSDESDCNKIFPFTMCKNHNT